MWDLIVSVPDHCLAFYFPSNRNFGRCIPNGSPFRLFAGNYIRRYTGSTIPLVTLGTLKAISSFVYI